MKTKIAIVLLGLALTLSCSKSSDPGSSQSSGSATATIGGKAFTATDTKVTDTGNGLDIKIASATETIDILTDAKTAGTYTIINTGGRAMAGTSASASYAVGTDVYLAVSGTVTVTVDANGKVSVTYSITLRNSAGTTIIITDGKLNSITVTPFQAPAGKCLVGTITSNETDPYGSYNSVSTAIYDSEGHLLRVNRDNGAYELFIWAGGVVTSRIEVTPTGTVDEKQNWFYTGGKLTKVMWYGYSSSGNSSGKWEYTLNAAGQPTKVVTTDQTSTYTFTHTYDANGNCTQTITTSSGSSTSNTRTYSGYDTKPNPTSLYLASLGITFDPDAEGGASNSKNNVGKEVSTGGSTYTYTYTYNAKGNVETISDTNGTGSSAKSTFSYVGCN